MLIKIALALFVTAITVLISAAGVLALHQQSMAEQLDGVGLILLLTGFALIVVGGLVMLGKQMWASVKDYFALPNRLYRKVLFATHRQQNLEQIKFFKMQFIAYGNQQRRKKLLQKDQAKQLKLLYQAINQQMQASKNQLTPLQYQQWRKTIRQHYRLQDAQGLLTLQQKFSVLTQNATEEKQ